MNGSVIPSISKRTYPRVLVVDASEHPPATNQGLRLSVSMQDGQIRTAATHTYSVQAVFKTLQEAADAAKGETSRGDAGTYAGFVLEDKPSAGDGRYIHFKAMGEPGDVIINQSLANPDWMILVTRNTPRHHPGLQSSRT